jgi:hypothetical protein
MAVISSDRNRSFIAGPLSLATNAAGWGSGQLACEALTSHDLRWNPRRLICEDHG